MKDCILPVKNDLSRGSTAHPNSDPPPNLDSPVEPRPFNRNGFEALVSSLSADALARYEGFCLSSAYYELTGRRGLWMASDGQRTVVYCRHPNVEHEYLVFPELGEAVNYDLTLRLVESLHADSHAVRLARFTARQATAILSRANGGRLEINEIDEDVLDWRHAIRILSVADVLARRGGRYERLRQRLKKIEPSDITVAELDVTRDQEQIESLANRWADDSRKRPFSRKDLLSPVSRLLAMATTPGSRLVGQVLHSGSKLIGCCIWEEPLLCGLPANQLAGVCDTSVRGLSEFQVVSMCARIAKIGIQTVSLGGSETHGLDRFKRKFGPIRSVDLLSLAVRNHRNTGPAENSPTATQSETPG